MFQGNKLVRNGLLAVCVAGAVVGLAASRASADEFQDNVDKVDTLSSTISGIVSSMTDVAIIPMGMGAAMKTFRHIVLNNV